MIKIAITSCRSLSRRVKYDTLASLKPHLMKSAGILMRPPKDAEY